MLHTAFHYPGPAAVRYPRGTGSGAAISQQMTALEIGKAEKIFDGSKVAILSFGSMLETAKQVAELVDATLINMRWIKPLDKEMILLLSASHELFVTIEDNVVAGGGGSLVGEVLHQHGKTNGVLTLGLPDEFIDHGTCEELYKSCGIDAESASRKIRQKLELEEKSAELSSPLMKKDISTWPG